MSIWSEGKLNNFGKGIGVGLTALAAFGAVAVTQHVDALWTFVAPCVVAYFAWADV